MRLSTISFSKLSFNEINLKETHKQMRFNYAYLLKDQKKKKAFVLLKKLTRLKARGIFYFHWALRTLNNQNFHHSFDLSAVKTTGT